MATSILLLVMTRKGLYTVLCSDIVHLKGPVHMVMCNIIILLHSASSWLACYTTT